MYNFSFYCFGSLPKILGENEAESERNLRFVVVEVFCTVMNFLVYCFGSQLKIQNKNHKAKIQVKT